MNRNRPRYQVAMNLFTCLASVLITFIVGISFTNHRINENNHKQCQVLHELVMPPPLAPNNPNIQPTSIYGRQLQEYTLENQAATARRVRELKKLSQEYGCEQ